MFIGVGIGFSDEINTGSQRSETDAVASVDNASEEETQ